MSAQDEVEVRPVGPAITIEMPVGGFTVADLLAMPESPYRIAHPGASLRRPVDPEEIAVAIEIESPTSGRIDQLLEPVVYADAKIPYFWRIELEPEPIAIIHHLEDGAYVEVARGPRIEVTEPFPFAVDLADLVDQDD